MGKGDPPCLGSVASEIPLCPVGMKAVRSDSVTSRRQQSARAVPWRSSLGLGGVLLPKPPELGQGAAGQTTSAKAGGRLAWCRLDPEFVIKFAARRAPPTTCCPAVKIRRTRDSSTLDVPATAEAAAQNTCTERSPPGRHGHALCKPDAAYNIHRWSNVGPTLKQGVNQERIHVQGSTAQ